MPRNYQRGHKRKISAKARPIRPPTQKNNFNHNNKKPHPNNFRQQLHFFGLQLKEMTGDGNCLFRALGDQFDGDSSKHLHHRKDVVNFMSEHRQDFEPFFFGESENSLSFEQHLKELSKPGVHAGNDVLVAFSRLHSLDIVVHQVGMSPWCIHGGGKRQLHLAFHEEKDHYSSIRQIDDMSNTPTKIRLQPSELQKLPELAADDDEDEEKELDDTLVEINHLSQSSKLSAATEDNDALIIEVMSISGCPDEELVRDVLSTFNNQLDETVDYLLNVYSPDTDKNALQHSDDNCDADDEDTVDPESKQQGASSCIRSSARTKRAKKQLKRDRAIQRRRRERGIDENAGCTSSDEFVVNGLNVLSL